MKDIRLIVFDWDGTLMDSEARIVTCLRNAIDDLQIDFRTDEQLKNIIGLGLKEALHTLYPEADDILHGNLTERFRHYFLHADKTPSPLFEGARELLDHLYSKELFLAIATGKGRAGLDKVLEETQLHEFFHYTRTAEETFSKPNPQMLLDIMDYLGVDASETLMIGDTEFDLQMAHNAGVKSIAISHGVHDRQRLLDCDPVHCVDNLADLHGWFEQQINAA